jgi:hypothetical protein
MLIAYMTRLGSGATAKDTVSLTRASQMFGSTKPSPQRTRKMWLQIHLRNSVRQLRKTRANNTQPCASRCRA